MKKNGGKNNGASLPNQPEHVARMALTQQEMPMGKPTRIGTRSHSSLGASAAQSAKEKKTQQAHTQEHRVTLAKKSDPSKPTPSPILAWKPHSVGSTRLALGRLGVRKSLCVRGRRLSTK